MLNLKLVMSPSFWKTADARKGDGLPCAICGKTVKDVKYEVHLVRGGSHLATAEDAAELNAHGADIGDMGLHPLGADCFRKHKDLLEPYVQRIQK